MIACKPNFCKRKFTDINKVRYNIHILSLGGENMKELMKDPGGSLGYKDPGGGWEVNLDPGGGIGMRDPGTGI